MQDLERHWRLHYPIPLFWKKNSRQYAGNDPCSGPPPKLVMKLRSLNSWGNSLSVLHWICAICILRRRLIIIFLVNELFSVFKLFYCCSITVVCIFSPPLYPTPANPPPSPASTLPLGFVHVFVQGLLFLWKLLHFVYHDCWEPQVTKDICCHYLHNEQFDLRACILFIFITILAIFHK